MGWTILLIFIGALGVYWLIFIANIIPDNKTGINRNSTLLTSTSRAELISSITIEPELTPTLARLLKEKYSRPTPHYLISYSPAEIQRIRKDIIFYGLKGSRDKFLIKYFQETYGIEINQAKIIVREESTLFMMTMKQARYLDGGVMEYQWRCVNGSPKYPVRPMHQALDGKIFRWDDPPTVNEKGERLHPGEDIGCRCSAIPIVKADSTPKDLEQLNSSISFPLVKIPKHLE